MKPRKLVDYHVHSVFSSDAKSAIMEMCESATRLGLGEIGFAEHMDFQIDPVSSHLDYDGYTEEIQRARRAYADRFVIRKGVEIDYQSRFEPQITEWLDDKQFDFVVGSVHYIDGVMIDSTYNWGVDLGKVYGKYLSEVRSSVESGLFDVVGHLDIVGRYVCERVHVEPSQFGVSFEEVLGIVAQSNVYLEINSKAINQGYADTMPGRRLVEDYLSFGGRRVSVGSDAHSSREVGRGVAEAYQFLFGSGLDDVMMLFAS